MEVDVETYKEELVPFDDDTSPKSFLPSPVMLLSGHKNEIYTCRFHPSGKYVASAGQEKEIFLWNVFDNCENYGILNGHKLPITELCFTYEGERLVTSSADKTVGIWDFETGCRIRTFKGHTSYVNSCSTGKRGCQMVVSGSDDGSLRIWDLRSLQPSTVFPTPSPILTCSFNSFGDQVISGGIDNIIKVWDLRKCDTLLSIYGHTDSITGIKLSPDGTYLISNSMDNTIRLWDIYPYSPGERCLKVFYGHSHNFEKNLLRCSLSPDSKFIACGSGDCNIYIWDSVSRSLIYKLPGHTGTVNDIDFHPEYPIIVSCGSDQNLFIGELST